MKLMNIEKKSFHLDSYTLENGESIPVTLGYETYGTLNEDKSNVILVAHYFSASSHAAGKYSEEDEVPGYWDGLIGPDKAVDTNKYFVISTDNLANVQCNNVNVITTGPRSINPKTGKRWGMAFPAYTFRDMAGIQKEFITKQLGIEKVYAVMGASAGGFIAQSWAVEYPEMLDKMIGVITNPQNPVLTSFTVLQHAMRAISMDSNWQEGNYEDGEGPVEGLELAIQMMNAGAFTEEFYENTYKRDSSEVETYRDIHLSTSYEKQLGEGIRKGAEVIDASHWYYTSRATMMHDIAHNHESFEKALNRIEADVLMISCTRDYLQPTMFNEKMIDRLVKLGKKAELFTFESEKGHMAGIIDTQLFENKVREFLDK